MYILSKYVDSFCEIKTVFSAKTVCTGYVASAGENNIVIKKAVFTPSDRPFDAIVSLLSKSRGLQVFKTRILSMSTEGAVVYDSLEKVTDMERRMAFRATVDLPALVTSDREPSAGYDAIIKDMSIKGISLWVHSTFSVDDIIEIQFPIEPVLCRCRCNIVRVIGNSNYSMKKYGCDFISMTDESSAAIQTFMMQKRTELMRQMLK